MEIRPDAARRRSVIRESESSPVRIPTLAHPERPRGDLVRSDQQRRRTIRDSLAPAGATAPFAERAQLEIARSGAFDVRLLLGRSENPA
jgi:hypothetical protein